jgi:Calcineurin-like phosphoesterase
MGSGDTLIHIAVRQNAPRDVLDGFLDLEADLEWQNFDGLRAHEVAENDASRYLLERYQVLVGASPKKSPRGPPPSLSFFSVPSVDGYDGAIGGAEVPKVSEEHQTICIGDLHGGYEKVVQLWSKLQTVMTPVQFESAYVFWLGDYVDKGPASREVLQWLTQIERLNPTQRHFFIAGNHDFSLQCFLGLFPEGQPADLSSTVAFAKKWDRNMLYDGPGHETMHLQGRRYALKDIDTYTAKPTFRSYGVPPFNRQALLDAMPQEHQEFLRDLPWCHDVETPGGLRIITAHAGFVADIPLEEQIQTLKARNFLISRSDSLSGRDNVLGTIPADFLHNASVVDKERTFFVSGHHHHLQFHGSNRIVIDSYAGNANNALSAVVLPSRRVVSAPGHDLEPECFEV